MSNTVVIDLDDAVMFKNALVAALTTDDANFAALLKMSLIDAMELGTAANSAVEDFASAAQGGKAATAVQHVTSANHSLTIVNGSNNTVDLSLNASAVMLVSDYAPNGDGKVLAALAADSAAYATNAGSAATAANATHANLADAATNSTNAVNADHATTADTATSATTATTASAAPWTGITGKPSTFPPSPHGHPISEITGLQAQLDNLGVSDATQSAHGLMSATDKTKLDGVAVGANNYVHPSGDGNRHVPSTTSSDLSKFLKSSTSAGAAPAWAAITKTDVGLANVDNTSDASKPVSTAQQTALNLKANLVSPDLTGIPTAPTASASTNTTQIATTAFVQAVVAALIAAAPTLLNTLDEIAAAINDDPNFAATMTTLINAKLAKSANLSDLADASIARTNLGLLSMALQASSNVNITGGTITGVDFDGGSF